LRGGLDQTSTQLDVWLVLFVIVSLGTLDIGLGRRNDEQG